MKTKAGDKIWSIWRYWPGETTSNSFFGVYINEEAARKQAKFQTEREDNIEKVAFKAEEIVIR